MYRDKAGFELIKKSDAFIGKARIMAKRKHGSTEKNEAWQGASSYPDIRNTGHCL